MIGRGAPSLVRRSGGARVSLPRLPVDQVVELIGTIASYNMVSRFVVATGVELE